MKVSMGSAWVQGFLLVVLFVVVGEWSISFSGLVFHRLGIDRNTFLVVLWVIPLVAAFVAARFSDRHKVVAGLSFMLVVPLIAAFGHYLSWLISAARDFQGVPGAIVVFKIYLIPSAITALIGTSLGMLASSKDRGRS